jgi:hypothetical protein
VSQKPRGGRRTEGGPKRKQDDDRAGIIDAIGRAGAYGLLGLLALVFEAALLAWFVQADSPAERITAGCLMAGILVGIIVVVRLIEGDRERTKLSAAVAMAASLDSPDILPAEIASRPNVVADPKPAKDVVFGESAALPDRSDGKPIEEAAPEDIGAAPDQFAAAPVRDTASEEIIVGPDRSYVLARPPKEWSIREATIESRWKELLGTEDISGMPTPPTGSVLVLQFGEGFTYTPQPDRTRINGRPIPLLLSETVERALRIATVPRREAPYFTERSLYDLFVMTVIGTIQPQLGSLVSLTPRKLSKANRDMVVGEVVQEFENLRVGDRWLENVRIESRYYAIRGDLVDYVLGATNFRVGTGRDDTAERMDADVAALFDSFRIVSVPDLAAAQRAEALGFDRSCEAFLSANGSAIFATQFGLAERRLREMSYEGREGLAKAISVLQPFRTFARMVGDPRLDAAYADLWAAMDAVDRGDGGVLRDFLTMKLKPQPVPDKALAAPLPGLPPPDCVSDAVSGTAPESNTCT